MLMRYIFFLLLSVWLGAFLAYRLPKSFAKQVDALVLFIAGYMLSSTLFSLLPDIFSSATNRYPLGLALLVGLLTQHFLVQLSMGVEHGHTPHVFLSKGNTWRLLLAISLHAFLEGCIGLQHTAHNASLRSFNTIFIGILLHKLPAAFVLASVLRAANISRAHQYLSLTIFSLATPLALFIMPIFLTHMQQPAYWTALFFAFIGGMFMHLAMAMFFEAAPKHIYGFRQNLLLLIGVLSAICIEYFLD